MKRKNLIGGTALIAALMVMNKKEKVKRSTKPSTVFFYDVPMVPAPDDHTIDQTGGQTPV